MIPSAQIPKKDLMDKILHRYTTVLERFINAIQIQRTLKQPMGPFIANVLLERIKRAVIPPPSRRSRADDLFLAICRFLHLD